MDTTEKKKSRDFNIYYLNFSKVYEIAMMINNVILTKIETDKSSSFEEQYSRRFYLLYFNITYFKCATVIECMHDFTWL